MDYSYALMDLTVYGRQDTWEDSPAGWPRRWEVNPESLRTNGRPTAQWSRLEAGHSDDLTPAKGVPHGTDAAATASLDAGARRVGDGGNHRDTASAGPE
jgi:hypothetical protein